MKGGAVQACHTFEDQVEIDLEQGFLLANWHIAPLQGTFSTHGLSLHIEPKVMSVLLYLSQNYNRVVSREELLNAVWGELVVSEEVLTRCISELRTALGDTHRQRRFIRTVPKRGYSLIMQPQVLVTPNTHTSHNQASGVPSFAVPPSAQSQIDTVHNEQALSQTLAKHIVAKKNMWALLSGAPRAMIHRSKLSLFRDFLRLLRCFIQALTKIITASIVAGFCFLSSYMLFAEDPDLNRLLAPTKEWLDGDTSLEAQLLARTHSNPSAFVKPAYESMNYQHADVAVLPLYKIQGQDIPTNEIQMNDFAQKFSTDLHSALSKIQNIRTALLGSQHVDSSETFSDIRRIGLELNIETLLVGTIRVDRNQVRLIVQLMNTDDGLAIWGRTYNRHIDEVSGWEQVVVADVVQQLPTFMQKK